MLNDRDQSCVLQIPLSESCYEDKLYWRFEDSGIYSVKSAYRLLQTQRGAWSDEANDRIWTSLWKIKAPPKTLNLVWRALSDCLPSLTQLQIKRVPVQVTCPVCQEEAETILRCLGSCRFVNSAGRFFYLVFWFRTIIASSHGCQQHSLQLITGNMRRS